MMKKVWKNRSGVSPVIATILMVAITVVLAAVLYVMVMGFNNGGNQTPKVSLGTRSTDVAGEYEVYVISVSGGKADLTAVQLVVASGDATIKTQLTSVPADDHLDIRAGDKGVVSVTTAGDITVLLRDKASGESLGQVVLTATTAVAAPPA